MYALRTIVATAVTAHHYYCCYYVLVLLIEAMRSRAYLCDSITYCLSAIATCK
jgi:hypothetical protein